MGSKNIKVISGVCIFLIFFIIALYNFFSFDSNEYILKDEHISRSFSNTISMMYETSSGSGVYEESVDSTWPSGGYLFNETLSKCENGSKLTWNDELKKVELTGRVSDKCYVYFDAPFTLADYIKTNVYTGTQGENNIYYHKDLENSAEDGSYRYAGSYESVNNYVCFGYDGSGSCPWDNMYRIIGVFGENVKLIKADYAKSSELGTDGSYTGVYDGSGTNKGNNINSEIGKYAIFIDDAPEDYSWGVSDLYKTGLSQKFLNTFNEKWQQKIFSVSWYEPDFDFVGVTITSSYPKDVYNYENSGTGLIENGNYKIGLMYVSDYMYGASPSAWKTVMINYETVTESNWMYMGLSEWTWAWLNDFTDSLQTHIIVNNGDVGTDYTTVGYAVRPCFYLNSDVMKIDGAGTVSAPYIVK